MSARDDILAALRRNAPPASPAPALDGIGVAFDDPVDQLAASMTAVGGTLLRVSDHAGAAAAIAQLSQVAGARRIVSLVPEVLLSSVDLAAVDDPHQLADLDVVILPGALAVAENAAVWLDSQAYPHRALFVIAEHLVLVVHAATVVSHMHEAYARLAGRAPGHGVFVSGPSKTADIEQVLVIGAQGPRTCTLVLIEPPLAPEPR